MANLFLSLPDEIMLQINSFLTSKQVAKQARTSKLFYSSAIVTLYNLYLVKGWGDLAYCDSISAYGFIYTKQLCLVDNWQIAESNFTYFRALKEVKQVKFGTDFITVLRHDGTLVSSISQSNNSLTEISGFFSIQQIDAFMHNLVVLRRSKASLLRRAQNSLLTTDFEVEGLSCIAAGTQGFAGTSQGKVYTWNDQSSTQVVFPKQVGAIKDLKANTKYLLVLTQESELFNVELASLQAVEILIGKNIGLIALGSLHGLALVREQLPPISQWDPQYLSDWMGKNGFADCCELIKNCQISGSDVEWGDVDYFIQTLGIHDHIRQSKLEYEISKVREKSVSKECELYGWGINNYSQIGIQEKVVKKPLKIKLPNLHKDEYFTDIKADKKYSYLVTSFGRVFAQGGQRFLRPNKSIKQAYEGFVEITQKLGGKKPFNVINIAVSNSEKLGVIYRERPVTGTGKIKMKTSEKIFKMITYSKRYNIHDYTVGYLDRFEGLVEIPASQFSGHDIPSHRIYYFKKNGMIMWDRRIRLDLM